MIFDRYIHTNDGINGVSYWKVMMMMMMMMGLCIAIRFVV